MCKRGGRVTSPYKEQKGLDRPHRLGLHVGRRQTLGNSRDLGGSTGSERLAGSGGISRNGALHIYLVRFGGYMSLLQGYLVIFSQWLEHINMFPIVVCII